LVVGDPYAGLKSRVTAPARVGCVLIVMVFVAISTLVTVVLEARVPVPEDCETKNPLEILEASGTTISKKGVVELKVIVVDPDTLEGSETVMSVALSTLTTVVLSGNSALAPDTVIPCTISVVDARTTVVDEDVTVAATSIVPPRVVLTPVIPPDRDNISPTVYPDPLELNTMLYGIPGFDAIENSNPDPPTFPRSA